MGLGMRFNRLPLREHFHRHRYHYYNSKNSSLDRPQSPSLSGALATAADASPLISLSQMLPTTLDIALDMALDTMAPDMAIEELEHFPVLGSAELDMLEPWRDQMTYSQLMNVMTKINLQSVEQETVLAWQQTFENRRRDPLGLDLDEFLDSLLEGAVEV